MTYKRFDKCPACKLSKDERSVLCGPCGKIARRGDKKERPVIDALRQGPLTTTVMIQRFELKDREHAMGFLNKMKDGDLVSYQPARDRWQLSPELKKVYDALDRDKAPV